MRNWLAATALASCLLAPAASAQTADAPDTEAGRYVLREADGEYLRVDRETGETSICRPAGSGWTCILVADDRAAYEEEIDRLTEENAELARELDALRQELAALPDEAPELEGAEPEASPDGRDRTDNEIILDLPSDEDLDQLSDTFETVMRRFVEMLRSLKSDLENQNEPPPSAAE